MFRPALIWLFAGGLPLAGHDVVTTKITWSHEVARIVYARCLECHRDGGQAFSLASYSEARPWAKAIKEEVLTRRMPPWNAVKGFGRFKNDRGLTQVELSTIADWVEGGAPEGDSRHMPERPGAITAGKTPKVRAIEIRGSVLLDRPMHAVGVRVADVPVGGSLQVVATRPDGSVEPLVWVRRTNLADQGEYWFRTTIRLPARTRLETIPSNGAAALLVR